MGIIIKQMVEELAWDIPKALKHSWPTYEVTKTENDCILYALGIGF